VPNVSNITQTIPNPSFKTHFPDRPVSDRARFVGSRIGDCYSSADGGLSVSQSLIDALIANSPAFRVSGKTAVAH
jgi:hypothetical protein